MHMNGQCCFQNRDLCTATGLRACSRYCILHAVCWLAARGTHNRNSWTPTLQPLTWYSTMMGEKSYLKNKPWGKLRYTAENQMVSNLVYWNHRSNWLITIVVAYCTYQGGGTGRSWNSHLLIPITINGNTESKKQKGAMICMGLIRLLFYTRTHIRIRTNEMLCHGVFVRVRDFPEDVCVLWRDYFDVVPAVTERKQANRHNGSY